MKITAVIEHDGMRTDLENISDVGINKIIAQLESELYLRKSKESKGEQ